MMPGRTLHRLATHICSAKTLERIVEPAIADLQKEFAAARRCRSACLDSAYRIRRDSESDGDLRGSMPTRRGRAARGIESARMVTG